MAWPALAVGMAILLLAAAVGRVWLVFWLLAAILAFPTAGLSLWFRNASLFSGAGYFGRTDTLGRRVVYQLADLRRVLVRMVVIGGTVYHRGTIVPCVIFLGDGNQVLLRASSPAWDADEMRRFLESLEVSPESDPTPISYQTLRRQLREGQV
jgi:hypothetical protein